MIVGQDFKSVLTTLFGLGWRFLTCFYIPGTRVTPGEFLLAIVFAWFCFRHILPLIMYKAAQNNTSDEPSDKD